MSTIYTPNAVKAEMVYTCLGQRIENVYYFTKGSPATLADLQGLYTALLAWENNTAKLQRSNWVNLVLISLHAMDAAGAPFYEAAPNPSPLGAQNSGPNPNFVTIAIKHTTGKGGRSYRGRSYWIGLPLSWTVNAEILSAANALTLATVYNTLRTSLLTAGWTFSICSQYSGVQIVNGYRRGIPRAQGVLTAVTASTCEGGLDTNRHRKLPYQK